MYFIMRKSLVSQVDYAPLFFLCRDKTTCKVAPFTHVVVFPLSPVIPIIRPVIVLAIVIVGPPAPLVPIVPAVVSSEPVVPIPITASVGIALVVVVTAGGAPVRDRTARSGAIVVSGCCWP